MLEMLRLSFNITKRNWTVYKKDFLANISPTVADPALVMVSLGMGLAGYVTSVEGMSYQHYLAPGLTVATALFTSFFESSYGLYVRMSYENVFKAMLTTPIGVKEIVLGEIIWVALKGALMALGVGIVLSFLGTFENLLTLPLTMIVGAMVAIPCGCIGILATALVRNINQFQTVYSFLIAPLYFLSGIFFPISEMHPVIKAIAEFFPLIHGVRMAQAIFWNRDLVEVMVFSGGILVLQGAVLGFWSYFQIRKKLVS